MGGMTEVNESNLTNGDAETTEGVAAPAGTVVRRTRRWAPWCAVTVVIIGSLWYGFSRANGPTVSATVADCSQTLTDPTTGLPVTGLRQVVVGLGTVASIAVLRTPTGTVWCFDGMGIGGGGISRAAMRSALDAPVAVEDGTLNSDVLMLVHLGQKTASVVVTTATSRSIVLSHGGGFEVLRVPTAGWPHWHAPWKRGAVTLGRVIGFDSEGRVTSSLVFSWCPGSINRFPGTAC
jgi:hypothetical protein